MLWLLHSCRCSLEHSGPWHVSTNCTAQSYECAFPFLDRVLPEGTLVSDRFVLPPVIFGNLFLNRFLGCNQFSLSLFYFCKSSVFSFGRQTRLLPLIFFTGLTTTTNRTPPWGACICRRVPSQHDPNSRSSRIESIILTCFFFQKY